MIGLILLFTSSLIPHRIFFYQFRQFPATYLLDFIGLIVVILSQFRYNSFGAKKDFHQWGVFSSPTDG